jgi:DNA-directed RNA polymerase subunit RPC12/RpoP
MHDDIEYYRQKMKKDDSKVFDSLNKMSYKCKKCNRTVVISRQDRALCPDCGHWVYKSDALEFIYKLREEMKKRRNDK